MKITYDKIADAMYVYFRKSKVAKTIELSDNLIVDVDKLGRVIGLEVLDASRQLSANNSKALEKSLKHGVPVKMIATA
ncbi:MAG: DUF2283 domain-containing protein [Candidatus Zambryskibacteria bacterium]|nr:DUF2283 domain-containing protein [Candidatus Zambryskibacteria bacterium]